MTHSMVKSARGLSQKRAKTSKTSRALEDRERTLAARKHAKQQGLTLNDEGGDQRGGIGIRRRSQGNKRRSGSDERTRKARQRRRNKPLPMARASSVQWRPRIVSDNSDGCGRSGACCSRCGGLVAREMLTLNALNHLYLYSQNGLVGVVSGHHRSAQDRRTSVCSVEVALMRASKA